MKDFDRPSQLILFLKDRYFWQPALSALLLGLSRYPLSLNFLAFAAFLPLLLLLDKAIVSTASSGKTDRLPKGKFLKLTLTFCFVYNLVTLYWISIVTLPGFIGTFLLFGVYFIVLFFIIIKVYALLPGYRYLGFITCWLSFEWLQNFGELRFPWFNLGYSLAEYSSLIQIAEIGGVYLLSLLILLINMLLMVFLSQFPLKRSLFSLLAAIVIVTAWIGWGTYRRDNLPLSEEDFQAAIVQVSIPQYIKWDDNFYDSTLALYTEYTLKAAEDEPDLIILPESAIPDYVLKMKQPKDYLLDLVKQSETNIFLGLPHYELIHNNDQVEYRFFNATTLIERDGTINPPYYKIYLVPFGERIPFMDYFPILGKLEFGQANWEYGEHIIYYRIPKNEKEYIFSSLICFEIAFPLLTNRIAAQQVDFLINVTNDAWFKKTVGPYQHGMMTTIRAVETRTQIYRAANTGISMIVDPRGVIRKRSKLDEKTTLQDKLYLYPAQTLYVRYLTYYPFIFPLITLVMFLIILIRSLSYKRL